jgi:hypothetical protein
MPCNSESNHQAMAEGGRRGVLNNKLLTLLGSSSSLLYKEGVAVKGYQKKYLYMSWIVL